LSHTLHDINSSADIFHLVDKFYKRAMVDDTIGFFFTEVMHLSLEKHIPVIVSFWETVLLDKGTYKGNPMEKHFHLNHLEPIKPIHFERWLQLWETTVNENFTGNKATEAINRARTIAYITQQKITLMNTGQ
jgi:hemoglobin